jgi:hypothetical protein
VQKKERKLNLEGIRVGGIRVGGIRNWELGGRGKVKGKR